MHIHNLKTLMSLLNPRGRAVKNKVINKDMYNPSIGIIFHFRFHKMTNLLLTLRLLIRLLLLHLHKKILEIQNPLTYNRFIIIDRKIFDKRRAQKISYNTLTIRCLLP